MMDELSYLQAILEQMETLNNRIEALIIIALFCVALHYSEKWLRLHIKK